MLVVSIAALAIILGAQQQQEHKTVTSQSIHYFARPHLPSSHWPPAPFALRAAWLSDEMHSNTSAWQTSFSDEQQAALLQMVGSLDTLRSLSAEKCRAAAPAWLLSLTERLQHELSVDGLGVSLIRRVPIDRWSLEQSQRFFWCLGALLGQPGAQNNADDLLGNVINEFHGMDAPPLGTVRQYRTREAIDFHCDAADVVGLLCLETAMEGGESKLASSISVYNELWRRNKTLAAALFEPMLLDTRGTGGVDYFPVEPARLFNGRLSTFFHVEYFRTAHDYPNAPPLSPLHDALIRTVRDIAHDPTFALAMRFERGDIQLISNHVVLHSRAAYHDAADRRRHLLRLWLSLNQSTAAADPLRFALTLFEKGRYIFRFVRAKLNSL